MICPKCQSMNADGKKYCGDCGALLQAIGGIPVSDLREQIRLVIREELKDQKVLEVEVSQAIVTRVMAWAKLFGSLTGALLALLLVLLGIKYTDLNALIDSADKRVTPVVQHAVQQANEVETKAADIGKRSDALQKNLAELEPKLAKIQSDSEKIAAYEKTFDDKVAGLDKEVEGIDKSVNQITEVVQKPGVYRWDVKTGTDPDAGLVGPISKPIETTVEDLIELPRPNDMSPATSDHPDYQNKRARPVETNVYSVEATIVALKLEVSGDYHLVLQGISGHTMIAAAPNPDDKFVAPTSRWKREITEVRRQIDMEFSPSARSATRNFPSVRARVVGVGFFNLVHGQTGVALNGIELRPVVSIQFIK